MREIDAANQTALEAGEIVARDFLSLWVRNRSTGDPVFDGSWSDVGNITADVIDPDTQEADERVFLGAGDLISISAIPLVSNITVREITITLSQVSDRVEDLHRTYDARRAPVQIHRGLFNPLTRALIAPAECRFVGTVDFVEVKTPKEGEVGSVVFRCKSHTQELTRSNPDMRSHESQILRSATDNFFQDVGAISKRTFFWGRKEGRLGDKDRTRRR